MQQSPCFKLFSPDETSKMLPSFQRFNNGAYSPRTLFYGLGLSSSGQNSYSKKNILSKMKYSTSNTKQIFNKQTFLSNKRHLLSESDEKNNNKKNYNNENINRINMPLNTIIKNDESIIETQNDGKKTKASSKKYSTYIPTQYIDGSNNFNNYYGYYNNCNYGCISNSSLIQFNKSAYIGSVKKNLLPSLSKELKSNSKNQNQNQKNIIENNKKINNNNSSANKNNNNNNLITNTNINKFNNSESIKKNNNSNAKSNINTSSKKTANDSTPYDYLCKTTETLDLEKMVDYIISSTKIYNRYNDNKDNYSNNNINNINNLINQNENCENNEFNTLNNKYYINSDNKSNKKNKKFNSSNKKSLNIDNQKNIYSICKCKKVECLKYSCSCLKSGNKCCGLCSCINCKNKDNNIFKILD